MQIAKLRFEDRTRVDTACLNAICEQMGPMQGEVVICAAMEDLAALLHDAHSAWGGCELDILYPLARQIAGIADRIGLVTLAQVARDVAALSASLDAAGLAAAMARMTRLGEGSLIAIWEAQVISR